MLEGPTGHGEDRAQVLEVREIGEASVVVAAEQTTSRRPSTSITSLTPPRRAGSRRADLRSWRRRADERAVAGAGGGAGIATPTSRRLP